MQRKLVIQQFALKNLLVGFKQHLWVFRCSAFQDRRRESLQVTVEESKDIVVHYQPVTIPVDLSKQSC